MTHVILYIGVPIVAFLWVWFRVSLGLFSTHYPGRDSTGAASLEADQKTEVSP